MTPFVDVNVYLGRWPFRRVPGDEPAELMAKLREQGVTQAWTGSLEGLWHNDLASVNARLTAQCAEFGEGLLLPFGSINPKLPHWEDDLRRCHEEHKMRGIRLHPNYHSYKLDEPAFAELLRQAAERGLIVQLAISMEDERTQSYIEHVDHVDPEPLFDIVAELPKLRLVLLNAFRAVRRLDVTSKLASTGRVFFEPAMLEGLAKLERIFVEVPLDAFLFGSYYPRFYFESALFKLKESALAGGQRAAIMHENAERLLK